MITYLSLLSLIPLLFFLIDGYYEKNMKKGLIQILAFIVTAIIVIVLIGGFGLEFIILTPIILLVFIVIKRFGKKNI